MYRMSLETSFFNMQMTNLFIGLFSRHPLLRPHSFLIGQLGYGIHSIEPSFSSLGKTINPEGIAYSESRAHTLLTEWTGARALSSEKREQIRRYLCVSSSELETNAKIKLEACDSHSIWLVVPPASLQSFSSVLDDVSQKSLIICSFSQSLKGRYCVNFGSGSFQDSKLSKIFSENMEFRRVPQGYISIPLENLRDKRFSDSVIQQVVTFIVNERNKFTVEDICKSMIGIWISLSHTKKKSIDKAVKRVMKELSQQTCCRNWLIYESPYWKVFDMSKAKLKKFLHAVEIGDGSSSVDEALGTTIAVDTDEEHKGTVSGQQIGLDLDGNFSDGLL